MAGGCIGGYGGGLDRRNEAGKFGQFLGFLLLLLFVCLLISFLLLSYLCVSWEVGVPRARLSVNQ